MHTTARPNGSETANAHAERPVRPAPGLSWVHEMGEALLWTRFLRVPALAARPQRVMLSLFLVVSGAFLGGIRMPWREPETPAFLDAVLGAKFAAIGQVLGGAVSLDMQRVSEGVARLIAEGPALAMTQYPVESILLGIPLLFLYAVFAGAVCRSVACEVSLEMTLSWTRQLGLALSRWRSLVGVLVLPMAVVGAIALALAAGGWMFFNAAPVLEIVGGMIFGIALLLGFVAVVLVVLLLFAWPMLLPAVVCEGTDAIDGVGRALAYTIARPLRLVFFLVVCGVVCALAGGMTLAVTNGAVVFTERAVGMWVSSQGAAELTGSIPPGTVSQAEQSVPELSTLAAASSRMVAFWGSILRVVAVSYIVSMVLTAGTMIYLFMRQVCDGQHYAELWTPGQIEQAFASAMRDTDDTADNSTT